MSVAINVILRLSPVFAYEGLFVLLLNTDTSCLGQNIIWLYPTIVTFRITLGPRFPAPSGFAVYVKIAVEPILLVFKSLLVVIPCVLFG